MTTKNDGANILIAGSKTFNDKIQLFSLLEILTSTSDIEVGTITISKFAGACEIAQEWVNAKNAQLPENKQIQVNYFSFDEELGLNNNDLYNTIEIPKEVLQSTPFYQNGKAALVDENIEFIIACPNNKGELGAATKNITRFADLAGIPVFNLERMRAELNEIMDNAFDSSLDILGKDIEGKIVEERNLIQHKVAKP